MKRGDIYLADLKEPRGCIQSGVRPVLVIQNDEGNEKSPTTIVASITSRKKKFMPTHLVIHRNGGLRENSVVLCEQLFTVNREELIKKLGTITSRYILDQLNQCLRISLDL